MVAKNYSHLVATSLLFLLLAIGTARAGLGMSAGALNFGEVPRGGQKTLSYEIINSGEQPIFVIATLNDDFSRIAVVEPKEVIIPAQSSIPLSVTVFIPEDAEPGTKYTGSVYVKTENPTALGGGNMGVTLQLANLKEGSVTAAVKVAPPKPPLAITGVFAILIIVLILIIPLGLLRRRRR